MGELNAHLYYCGCLGLEVYFLILGLINFSMVLISYVSIINLLWISWQHVSTYLF